MTVVEISSESSSKGAESTAQRETTGAERVVQISQPRIWHFWLSGGPFFETVLLVANADSSCTVSPVKLIFFDPDGFPLNELVIESKPGRIQVVETEPLLGACKFESGIKYAHCVVQASASITIWCRVQGKDSFSFIRAAEPISAARRRFFPVVFSKERVPLIALINHSEVEATVRARLFSGKRSPEAIWMIPARGARVMSLASEFGDYLELADEDSLQSYVRLGVRGEYEVSTFLLERAQGPKDCSLFLGVS